MLSDYLQLTTFHRIPRLFVPKVIIFFFSTVLRTCLPLCESDRACQWPSLFSPLIGMHVKLVLSTTPTFLAHIFLFGNLPLWCLLCTCYIDGILHQANTTNGASSNIACLGPNPRGRRVPTLRVNLFTAWWLCWEPRSYTLPRRNQRKCHPQSNAQSLCAFQLRPRGCQGVVHGKQRQHAAPRDTWSEIAQRRSAKKLEEQR